MKKLTIPLIFILFFNISYAGFIRTPEEQDKLNNKNLDKSRQQLLKIATINGFWVGYGQYCKVPKETLELMHNKFIISVHNRLKNDSDKKLLLNQYEKTYIKAVKEGPSHSKGTCDDVIGEYKKMKAFIESDGDMLINNKVDSVVVRKDPNFEFKLPQK